MKIIYRIVVIHLYLSMMILASCKKSISLIPDPKQEPPVARAGQDISGGYDCNANTVTLTGISSSDLYGIIESYSWTQIYGPTQATIVNPGSFITKVNNLNAGSYGFRLTVKDKDGLTDDDTVLVHISGIDRPVINAQLIPIGTLSQSRSGFAVNAAGNKIVIAGGLNEDGIISSARVDIFDKTTNKWTIAELSQARHGISTTVLGSKIFFAGGYIEAETSATIDIYDIDSNTWTTANLSESRSEITSAVVGNKVLFGGGYTPQRCCNGFSMFSKRVDMYDKSTGVWSTFNLSEERVGINACQAGNKIYFAGGTRFFSIYDYNPIEKIDVYDAISNSWTVSALSEHRGWMSGISLNNKIYWAGGNPNSNDIDQTNLVEIRDINTQTSSFACLFQPNAGFKAVSKNNEIVFFTGQGKVANKFDIYNDSTHIWSIGVLSKEMRDASIVSIDNVIYIAGGYVNGVLSNQVYKLEF